MTLAGLYPWLKALHVASALIFVGGVISVAVFLAAASTESVSALLVRAVRRWDQLATTPAMLLVWTFGLALASGGGWLASGWLQAKLVLVVALSAIHGMQSGRLRQLGGGGSPKAMRTMPMLIGCVVGVAVLAIVKPF